MASVPTSMRGQSLMCKRFSSLSFNHCLLMPYWPKKSWPSLDSKNGEVDIAFWWAEHWNHSLEGRACWEVGLCGHLSLAITHSPLPSLPSSLDWWVHAWRGDGGLGGWGWGSGPLAVLVISQDGNFETLLVDGGMVFFSLSRWTLR